MLIALIITMAVCGAYVAVHWLLPLQDVRRWAQDGDGTTMPASRDTGAASSR
jgi:hypothetical protein